MSWGIDITGTKAGVAKKATEQLDKIAAGYAGKEEGKDVLAAKERILSILDALELGKDGYGTEWNAVNVKANGSHSITGTSEAPRVISANFQVSITRTSLALDPA